MIIGRVEGKIGDFKLECEFKVPGAGVTAVFGRSGSGKTSLLRWMAGLEPQHTGTLIVNGQCWQEGAKDLFVPAHRRRLGYVFQDPGLFSHLSVRGNLEYAFKRALSTSASTSWEEVIDLLGLASFLERRPRELSGGQRQRVALGRALLASPQILLLDEPLAALDQSSKEEILQYLERIKERAKLPIFFITHSQEEVLRFADHLLEIEDGSIKTAGSPAEFFAQRVRIQADEEKREMIAACLAGAGLRLGHDYHFN